MMAALPNSLSVARTPRLQLSPAGASDQFNGNFSCPTTVSFAPSHAVHTGKRTALVVKASSQSDGEGSNHAAAFLGGFILGGLVVGTLGCAYAPQISKALTGADRKDLMRKLPKFIYDEEKALEKTRKILTEKIAQLSSAIDDVSAQLHSQDAPNGAPDEVETAI